MLDQLASIPPGLPGSLVLRIHGDAKPADAPRVVRIAASRCAIGADGTCNLRINGPGSHPLHCLIVRGRDCVVVRRWSPDTLLNGVDFGDAVLSPGDRLRVADIEFEVVDLNADGDDGVAGEALEIVAEPAASLQEVLLRRLQPEMQWRQSRDTNRARARRLLAELRIARQQLQEFATLAQTPEPGPGQEALEQIQTVGHIAPIDVDQELPSATAAETEQEENEVRFEPVSTDAPVSASALLGSLGMSDVEEDADEPLRSTAAVAESEEESDDRRRTPRPEGSGEESEESIEVMFARLLKRVGQPREEVSYRAKPTAAASPARAPAPEAPREVTEEEKPAILTELPAARSARPAEHKTDLSVLRELAHLNTRSLLDLHFRRSFKRTTAGQALVTGVAFVGGILLIYWSRRVPMAFYLGILCFAVAIVWGVQNAAAVRHMVQDRWLRKRGDSDPSQPATAQQLRPSVAEIEAEMPLAND